jgi:1-acyl-sn-glycerol-3-phosphate acyltransferase
VKTMQAEYDMILGDAYSTPEGIPQALSERLLLGSRWSVYMHFFGTILRSRALALAGLYDDEAWARSSMEIIRNLERCAARLRIEGMDKVRSAEGALVFVANHMSTLETVVIPGLIRPMKPVTYVVKRKLLGGFFWGPIMRSRDPIAVTRMDPRADLETVLRDGQARLASGISVIIFPQGTRTEVWRRRGFNSLGVKLASRAGVPIVPVALKTDYWGSSGLFRGFGPVHRDREVHLEFGDPIAVSRKDPRADLEIVLREGQGRLASGISVIVFPQGTRTEVWRREGFNSLGIKLASRAGARVMPVALKTDYWGSGGLFRGFGPVHRDRIVHIEFGDAMSVSGRGKAEHERCLDFIESRLKGWGARIG